MKIESDSQRCEHIETEMFIIYDDSYYIPLQTVSFTKNIQVRYS